MSTLNTNCILENRRAYDNGVVRVTMRMLGSTRPQLATNELPNLLHTIGRGGVIDSDTPSRLCFDYPSYGFPMLEGDYFPYPRYGFVMH